MGTITFTVITLDATTLTLSPDGDDFEITFFRSASGSGLVGTWTAEEYGDTYILTVMQGNEFTLQGQITGSCFANAHAQHWPEGYQASLSFDDPGRTALSVTVSGPGIAGSTSLCYSDGRWNNWTYPCETVHFASLPTQLPLVYVFTVTDGGGTRHESAQITCFVEDLPSNLAPDGTASGTPVFTWTRINQNGYEYCVQLHDSQYNRIWESDDVIDAASAVYNGPPLQVGQTYNYFVVATDRQGDCSAFGRASFLYTGTR